MNEEIKNKLEKILSKTGDLNFRRRVLTMVEYLDVQPGEKILDMGCGEGFYSMIFDELYQCEIYAVDCDPKILSLARKRLEGRGQIKIEEGDITSLKFPDSYFDKIVCTEVLEHVTEDEKAIKELYRVLKPGGTIAITVPNKNYPLLWDPLNKIREKLGLGHFSPHSGFWGGIWAKDHKRLYLPQDLKKLVENANFETKDLRVLTHYGIPFNHLILYLGKTLYTRFPVPESMKVSMEKFDWEKDSGSKGLLPVLINAFFVLLKKIDEKNETIFPLDKSTMAVALKAIKK